MDLVIIKNRLDDMNRQISNIKNESYFIDYTENEEIYNKFINKNKMNSESSDYSINILKSKIIDFKQKDEFLSNEISKINASICSNEEILIKYEKNKREIVNLNFLI